MNKSIIILLLLFLIIICIICVSIINIRAEKREIQKENMEYEIYLDKEISGTEIATIISKAIDQNKRNNVSQDEKGYYIDDGKDSIKIDLKMITVDKTYPMEEIYNNKIVSFIENFDTINFECKKIEYHEKTGKISKIIFEEIE